MNEISRMTEVTESKFRELYFELGRGQGGWTAEWWDEFTKRNQERSMSFKVKFPESRSHNRMMIVSDYQTGEHRMFFVTEDEEEQLFCSYEAAEPRRPWWQFWH